MAATLRAQLRKTLESRHDVMPLATVVLVAVVLVALFAAGLAPLVLVAALVFPVAVAIVVRPQWGLLVLAALVPYHGLLLILPTPSWALGWKEALVVALVVVSFVRPDARAGVPRRVPGWVLALGGLLVLGVGSAAIVGGSQALVGLKISFFYVLVAVVAWRCPLDRGERDVLVSIMMVNGFVTALVGIAQQALGHVYLSSLGYEYNSVIRFTGGFLRSFSTFVQPFPFALFLMLVLLVGIPLALDEIGRLRNRLFLLATPVILLGMLTAIVRSAWMGLAIGLCYLGFTRYRVLLLGIPLALVALLFLPGNLSAAAFTSSSLEARTTSWSEELGQVLASPFGNGIATTGAAAEKVATLDVGTDAAIASTYQPDNSYYKVLYEFGLLGLWFFVLLLACAFLSARAVARHRSGRDRAFALGVSAAFLAAGVASLVATYFEIFPMDALFWLFLGVISAMQAEDSAGTRAPALIERSARA